MVTARIPIPEFFSSLCVWWGESACSSNTSTCQSPSQSSVRCANFPVPEGLLSRNQNQSILSVLKHFLLVSSIKSHTSVEAARQKRDAGGWRQKVLMLTSKIQKFPDEATQECQYHPTYSTTKRMNPFFSRDVIACLVKVINWFSRL